MISVFGHKSPDTDATASAIVWAWYLTSKGRAAIPYVLGTPNAEADFVLKRWGYDTPAILQDVADGQDCVLVDTNNVAELPDNINNANVIEIIDHHMLQGGLKTVKPITITIKPLASTASVMVGMMGDQFVNAPESIKGLILSCILSDTLEFRSPTTTPLDQEIAKSLAVELGLNLTDYANEMFAAKSDVSRFSDVELLRVDGKEYTLEDTKLRVSVLETTTPDLILARKAGLMAAMKQVAQEDGVDQVLLFVVDILNQQATLLILNDVVKGLAIKSFGVQVDGDEVILPGVMSRKKQIIPNLAL